MTKRTRRGIAGSVLLVVAVVVAAVIVTALRAEGREHTEAETNDGGAWLLKADQGYIGHVNRAVQELSARISVADAGSVFDTDQAEDVVLVQDRTAGTATMIDDANDRKATTVAGIDGSSTTVDAVDGGVLVYSESALALWRFSRDAFASLETLDDEEPIMRGEGPGKVATFDDGHAVIADQAAGAVVFMGPDGTTERSPDLDLADDIVALTALGPRTAVIADSDGDLSVVTPDEVRRVESGVTGADGQPAPLLLQQPGGASDAVVGATSDGRVFSIPVSGGEGEATQEPTQLAQLAGGDPVRPLVVQGCTFAVSQDPATFLQVCGDEIVQQEPLSGAGSELRLRYVNGWVWINDVESGAAWVTEPEHRLDEIEDWGAILSEGSDDPDDDEQPNDGQTIEQVVDPDNPDAEIVESDQIDEEGPNLPPVARDDEAATRLERPVNVAVLNNDSDPNGDVLVVTEIQHTGGDAVVAITPGGAGVQVSPEAGFSGIVSFGYSISDGRGESASASVVVTVADNDGTDNRPPEPTADIASTRRGRPTTFDVLANDTDPDGDALVLESVALSDPDSTAGTIVQNPSGEVVFTPDPNTRVDHIELTYVISDDYGATAEGKVVVDVRLDDANNEPDARNDFGATTVGTPARIDLLDNDTDPDSDALFVGNQPTLVRPEGQTIDSLEVNVTPDGELFFNPPAEGTYVFNYSVTDGRESDVAQIRVDVDPAAENRPPVPVRDDVVIPAGGSRLVRVLDNDGDPDGDVVALVSRTADENGLRVEEVDGIGYMVTVAPDARSRETFRYAVSDGRSDPVSATVVVAVTDGAALDEPPVARDDVGETRAGGRVSVPALDNDYDPEGGVLRVGSVTSVEGVEAEPGLNGQSVQVTLGPEITSTVRLGYTIVDEGGNQASGVISISVVPPDEVNRPPIARTDIDRTRAGVPVAIDVLANDADPDGDIIALEAVAGQPSGGPAEVRDGFLVYTPSETFAGTDRLSYVVVDERGETSIGQALVGVMPLRGENREPEAFDDRAEVIAGSAPLVLDVLGNDSDPDGDRLLVTRVGEASAGSMAIDDVGEAVVFTPPETGSPDGSPLEVTVPYAVADGRGGTAEATITLSVITATEPIAPVAVDDLLGPLSTGETIEIDLLANDVDPDGNPAELVVGSDDPALAAVDGGVLTYTAGATSSRHRYTVTDPDGLSATGELSVVVVPNRAPVVAPVSVETQGGAAVEIDVVDAAGVTDPDGDALAFACCNSTVGGTTDLVATGNDGLIVNFTPDDGFSGPASFTYNVDDGQPGHVVSGAVVVVVISPANTAPTVAPGAFDIVAGTTTPVDLASLVTDPDQNEQLSFSLDGQSNDLVSLVLDGSTVVATTAADQGGQTSSFDFTVTDRGGESASGTVTLTLRVSDEPAPEAGADVATTLQGQAVTIPVLTNDIDHFGQGLVLTAAGATPQGQAAVAGDQITFTPNADFFGAATFNYTLQDARRSVEREGTGQVTVNVIGRPLPPGAPSAVADNATAVVTWSPAEGNGAGVDAYEVQGGGQTISTGGSTTATFGGLTNGVPVQFTVRAHNAAGWSEWSAPSPAVTPDVVPGRPAAPAVQFGNGQLTVTWSPPANEGSAINNYNLEIGGNAGEVRAVGNRTTYVWDGLQNGAEYTFRVQAVNQKGEGEWSASSAAEHPLTTPDPTGTPVGTRGDGYIDLVWSPGGNGGDQITQYRVQINSTGETRAVNGTSYRWPSLPNGQAQSFQVQAYNRAGWGPFSASSTPVTPCGAPTAPTGVQATPGDQSATVTWGPSDARGCAISQYTVRASGGGSTTVGGGTTTATVGGLSNGTTYTFTVVATNEVGNSPAGGPSNAVVPAGPPGPPNLTNADPSVGCVSLAWSAADPNGSAVLRYEVSINGGGWQSVGNTTSHRVCGLQEGTTYTFQVRAVNGVGPGAASNTRSATTPGRPNQVGGLSVAAPDRNTVTASWSTPNGNGSPVTSFDVEIDPGGVSSTTANSMRWDGRTPDTVYRVRVRAINAVGPGAWSNWESVRTPPPPPPPTQIIVGKGSSAVGLPGCSHSSCRHLAADIDGMSPNTSYQTDCFSVERGKFDTGTAYIRTNGSGNYDGDLSCYYGYPGEHVYITVGGRRSDNTLTW